MKKAFAGFLVVVLLVGCAHGGGKPCPAWFDNPPKDPNFMFATATGLSKDLQLAINKAKAEARAELAAQVETQVMSLFKKFNEEVGNPQEPEFLQMVTDVKKLVVDQTLYGSRIAKQHTAKEGDAWRACVLMEVSFNDMKMAMMDQIKKQEALYTRWRASQAFKELEEEVEKLREYKEKEIKGMQEMEKKEEE